MRHQFLVLFVIVLTAVTTSVSAQEQDPRNRALQLQSDARELFEAGEYSAAAERFHEAYETFPHPSLLSSEIVARFKAGQCDAVEPLVSTLSDDLESLPERARRDVSIVRTDCVLKSAREALEYGDDEGAGELVDRAEALDVFERRTDEISGVRRQLAEESHAVAPPAGGVARSGEAGTRGVVGWALTGAGVAVLATQTAITVSLLDESKEYRDLVETCEAACSERDRARLEELHDERTPKPVFHYLQYPMWIGGGLLTAVGVGVLALGPGRAEQQPVSLSLSPVGAALRWTF